MIEENGQRFANDLIFKMKRDSLYFLKQVNRCEIKINTWIMNRYESHQNKKKKTASFLVQDIWKSKQFSALKNAHRFANVIHRNWSIFITFKLRILRFPKWKQFTFTDRSDIWIGKNSSVSNKMNYVSIYHLWGIQNSWKSLLFSRR